MTKKKKKTTANKWKTKKWYTIHAPPLFEEKEIGEAVSSDSQLLIGRIVKATLKDITGSYAQDHIQLNFKINDVKGTKATTRTYGHELQKAYMKRHN